MCGFAGIVNFAGGQPPNPPAITIDLLQRLGAPVACRGPDGQGTFISPDGRAGLIHYRLSIVDLAGGSQPLSNEDGSVWIAFNGEVYNHVELRPELERLGHKFRTDHSDTEVIVHAYEQYGQDCAQRFRGQFAFAIVDLNRRTVLLCRDHLGQKPLYWAAKPDGTVVFASSSNCIRPHLPPVSRPDQQVLHSFLRVGYAQDSATPGLWQVSPGSWAWAQFTPEGPRRCEQRYWTPGDVAPFRGQVTDAQAAVRRAMVEATELRLRADVEVACFLSGGTDSAIVASIVRRELGRPIRTFTIGTPDPIYDEREPARRVARELGTEHVELELQPEHLMDALDDMVETVGEPFADSSIIPTYWVSRLTRPHVKVALSGDGGDEAFGGYDRYKAARMAWRLRWTRPFWWLTWPIWNMLGGQGHRGMWTRLRRLADGLRRDPASAYRSWVTLFSDADIKHLLKPGSPPSPANALAGSGGDDPPRFPSPVTKGTVPISEEGLGNGDSPLADPVRAAILCDYREYLPGDILAKVDRASMRVALEVRSPFLDYRLVELATSLPSQWKVRGHGRRAGKWILRQTFRNIVPRSVWTQPKRGFALPLDRWFRGELLPLLRESVGFLPADVFNHGFINQLIEAHVAGRGEHSQRLWALLWLGRWWKRFVGRA